MFDAAAVSMMIQTGPLPQKRNWGSCSDGTARVVQACYHNDVLNQVVSRAFHTWSVPGEDIVDEAAEDAEALRRYVRGKTRRMRRVLADMPKKTRFAFISLIAHPVDVLLSWIQLLHAQKGALKHFIGSKRTPLGDARKALCINATSGQNEGHVGTLFWRYGSLDVHMDFARKI